MVRAHHHQLGVGGAQDADHVRPPDPLALELLETDLGEARFAELRGHVFGGRMAAGRAPRVGAEGGQGRGVAQGGLAIDGGGEKRGEQGGHTGPRL